MPASLVRFAADMIAATRIEVVADFLPTFDLHDKREALAALTDTEALVLAGDGGPADAARAQRRAGPSCCPRPSTSWCRTPGTS